MGFVSYALRFNNALNCLDDGGMEELGACCCGGSKMITWMMDKNRNGGRRTDCRHSAHSVVHYDY